MSQQVDGSDPLALHRDVRLSWRQVEFGSILFRVPRRQRGVPVKNLLHRPGREFQADARTVGLGTAVGMIVNLNDDVRAFGQHAADPVGQTAGLVPGRPTAEVAVDLDSGAGKALVTKTRIGLVAFPTLPGRIHIGEHVVNDLTIARPVFDRRDVHIFRQLRRDHEATVDIASRGRHGEILRGFEDQVGRAECPVVGKPGWRGQVGAVAFGSAGDGPGGQRGDV